MELEVAVKVCVKNISKLVYCKVFIRCGHTRLWPALVYSVYVKIAAIGPFKRRLRDTVPVKYVDNDIDSNDKWVVF